ncbi:MAG: KEOPS complex subunit Cgi121, partial [Candidatus Heimdallarchaeaceae archaeon]
MHNEEAISFHYQAFFSPKDMNIDEFLENLKLKQNEKVQLQLIDPTSIVSEKHLLISIYHTLRAFEQNRNIARDQATEFLLRVSGKKQISSALELFGIKLTSNIIMVVSFGGSSDENKEAIEKFLSISKISEENILELKFPLISIKELSQRYECEEDILIIEKRVLEEIASLA